MKKHTLKNEGLGHIASVTSHYYHNVS